MKMKYEHHYFEALNKKTGKVVSMFLTHQEMHFKNQSNCLIPVYTDNGGKITQDYVDFNDLEFIYTQKEDIPDTIRDIKT